MFVIDPAPPYGPSQGWFPRAGMRRIIGLGTNDATAAVVFPLTQNRVYFVPFMVSTNYLVSQMAINVTTPAAGTCYLGIYADSVLAGENVPGLRLAQSATPVSTAGAGVQSTPVVVQLVRNVQYWGALKADVIGVQVRGIPIAAMLSQMGVDMATNDRGLGMFADFVSGGLPVNGAVVLPTIFTSAAFIAAPMLGMIGV